MNDLFIDLDKLGQRSLTVDYDFPASRLDADDEEFTFDRPVTGSVSFTRVNQDVVASGELRTVVKAHCARCLDPVDAPVAARVDELWTKKSSATAHRFDPGENEDLDPDLTHVLESDRIELADLYRELLVAELPARLLCREDCQGICTGCGANLNREPCRCDKTTQPEGAQTKNLPEWKRELKNLRLDS